MLWLFCGRAPWLWAVLGVLMCRGWYCTVGRLPSFQPRFLLWLKPSGVLCPPLWWGVCRPLSPAGAWGEQPGGSLQPYAGSRSRLTRSPFDSRKGVSTLKRLGPKSPLVCQSRAVRAALRRHRAWALLHLPMANHPLVFKMSCNPFLLVNCTAKKKKVLPGYVVG